MGRYLATGIFVCAAALALYFVSQEQKQRAKTGAEQDAQPSGETEVSKDQEHTKRAKLEARPDDRVESAADDAEADSDIKGDTYARHHQTADTDEGTDRASSSQPSEDSQPETTRSNESDQLSPELKKLERQSGLSGLPAQVSETEARLAFRTRPKAVCHVGDADVIKRDLKADPDGRLLITVEPILPNDHSYVPTVKTVDPQRLDEAFALNFTLPPPDQPVHLGLFVCKDASGDDRCAGKDFQEINRLHERQEQRELLTKAGAGDDVDTPEDKIYAFHYLVLDRRGLFSMGERIDGPRVYDSLFEYARKRFGAGRSRDQIKKAVDRVERLMTTLRSVQLSKTSTGQGESISFVLPHYDKNACES